MLILIAWLAARQVIVWRRERWVRRRLAASAVPAEPLPPGTKRSATSAVYLEAQQDGGVLLMGYFAPTQDGSPHPMLFGAPVGAMAFGSMTLAPGLVLTVDMKDLRDTGRALPSAWKLNRILRDGRLLLGGQAELDKAAASLLQGERDRSHA